MWLFCTDSYDEHFTQTIATLPLLDVINEIHYKKLNNMKMASPDVKFPPLHEEVFPWQDSSWHCCVGSCRWCLWLHSMSTVECFLSSGSSLWPLHAAAVVCHVAGRFQLLLQHRTDVSSVYCTCRQNVSDWYFCWVECLRCLFWPCFKLPCGIITAKWNVFCRCTVVKAVNIQINGQAFSECLFVLHFQLMTLFLHCVWDVTPAL